MKNSWIFALVGVTLLGTGGLIAYGLTRPNPYEAMTSRELLTQCTTDMATRFHIHSHLTILINGQEQTVPAGIGIDEAKNCMSSVHTHETDGVIHIEAPAKKDFTLGDFFYNWNQPFSPTQILDYKTDSTHAIKLYVDGEESNLFDSLVLQSHQSIVIDYYDITNGPDPVPANYTFAADE